MFLIQFIMASLWFLITVIVSLMALPSLSVSIHQLKLETPTISAAPALSPIPPPSTELSPDISPLLPSSGGPTGSNMPTIPSNPSPPNPDELGIFEPGSEISPSGSLPASSASSSLSLVMPLNVAVFMGGCWSVLVFSV